ncbi:integrase, catalytic region, zinc finger, CCHC-type containing protein [Tanacetum coccineum]
MQISQLKETRSELDRTLDFRARDFQISQLIEKVNGLQEQNELFRAENAKIMQHTTRNCMIRSDYGAKNSEQITALKNEMESKANYRIRSHVSLQIRFEFAFRKHSCYVRDTDGVELLKGSHGSNLYTNSIEDMMKSSQICLLSKASKHKSWLWHRRLNHLNFGTINNLARKDLVRGYLD